MERKINPVLVRMQTNHLALIDLAIYCLALTDIMAYQSHKLMKMTAAAGNNDNNVACSIKVQSHFEISQL